MVEYVAQVGSRKGCRIQHSRTRQREDVNAHESAVNYPRYGLRVAARDTAACECVLTVTPHWYASALMQWHTQRSPA